jgi:hypothetical protein
MTRTINLFNQISSSFSKSHLESVSCARMTRRISPFTFYLSASVKAHALASIEWRGQSEREHNYSAIVWTGDDTMELSKHSENMCFVVIVTRLDVRAGPLSWRAAACVAYFLFLISHFSFRLSMQPACRWKERFIDLRCPLCSMVLSYPHKPPLALDLEFGDFSLLMSAH